MKLWFALSMVASLATPCVFADPPQGPAWMKDVTAPQLYFDNDHALQARLQLLEQAHEGSLVQVATFDFGAGDSTDVLVKALCRAAQRKATVQFLTDSHYGSDPLREEAFNISPSIKKNQEMFQFLANCGVDVRIHNSLSDYAEIQGTRLPNLFPDQPGGKVDPIKASNRLSLIFSIMSRIIDNSFRKQGVAISSGSLLNQFKFMAKNISRITGISDHYGDLNAVEQAATLVRDVLLALVNDPAWPQLSPNMISTAVEDIHNTMKKDGLLGPLLVEIRKYNRLNHKKMFLVETEPGVGCLIIGGRNLSDSYLANKAKSFHDTDVMVCKSAGITQNETAFTEAHESFRRLLEDHMDPGAPNAPAINLQIPRRDRFVFNRYKAGDVNTPPVQNADVVSAGDASLPAAADFHLLTSEWSFASDQIRAEFLRMIRAEAKEIYIESPYAEFDREIKQALIDAVAKRNVRVTIITNGLFTSDGPSKLIRFTMTNFIEDMRKNFPDTFFVLYTSPQVGRMTHSKIAVFRSQMDETGRSVVRTIVGSHNFHQRSSSSDKEHALVWNQPTDSGADMIDLRLAYYNQLKTKSGLPQTSSFKPEMHGREKIDSINHELRVIKGMGEPFRSSKNTGELAFYNHTHFYEMVLGRTLFVNGSGLPDSFASKQYKKYLEMKAKIDNSSLGDLIGLFL
jgi:phosphatidylserine/phosphatidylglycerophosphate/cardiolipin synthase-like enzyme